MPSDWSITSGLRVALRLLLVRSILCLLAWFGVVWLVTPVANMLPMHWTQFALVAAIMAIPGGLIGAFLAKDLTERAGFVSMVLTGITLVFAWGVVLGGSFIAGMIRPLGDWQSLVATGAAAGVATVWVVKNTLLDAD